MSVFRNLRLPVLGILALSWIFAVDVLAAVPVSACYSNDFQIYTGFQSSSGCAIGNTADDSVGTINSLFGKGWNEVARTDSSNSDVSFKAEPNPSDYYFLDWYIEKPLSYQFDEAVFVVSKKARPDNPYSIEGWIGYKFEDLSSLTSAHDIFYGYFYSEPSFISPQSQNEYYDYDHMSLYVRGEKNVVPEMDLDGAGLSLGFLSALFLLSREYKAKRRKMNSFHLPLVTMTSFRY